MYIHVIGARGMLGQAVLASALDCNIMAIKSEADIRTITPEQILAPVVINCAGIVKGRADKTMRDMAEVNAAGPHRLAWACREADARLIQVSTDCVFTGPGPHDEQSLPGTWDSYALSKLTGEIVQPPHLTIRTSFVGFGQRGLIAQMLRGDTIRVSHNLLWTGHTVRTVADILIALALRPQITRLLHIPGETQSRAALVQRLQAHLGTSAPVVIDDTFYADRRLTSRRWETECGDILLPPFAVQLMEMERLYAQSPHQPSA